MINRITLENFRGFKSFMVPLTKFTLFGGKNNSGKTSLLEAFFFNYSHLDPNCFFKMNYLRHMNDQPLFTAERLWEPLFYDFNTQKPLKIKLEHDERTSELVMFKNSVSTIPQDMYTNIPSGGVLPNSFLSNYPLAFTYKTGKYEEKGNYLIHSNVVHTQVEKQNEDAATSQMILLFKSETFLDTNIVAQWFGQLVLGDKKKLVIDALKCFDKEIVDIQTIVKGSYGYLYVMFENGKKMPVSYMGDGMNRMLNILLGILSNPGSIILLDEVENGFHYSMYQQLWKLIGSAAVENDCQIIANTHSWDMLQGAMDGLKSIEQDKDLSYIRLDRNSHEIKAHIFSSDLLDYALSSEVEVR